VESDDCEALIRYHTGMRRVVPLLLLFCSAFASAQEPIPVKVVVIALFEPGNDSGDAPGEYQYWVERNHLDHIFPFPQGNHDLRMNNTGVLGILAGVGNTRAAASIEALALDPRFDLTKAYWLVAGIAGVDPEDASLGSAAWAEWIVDGDLAHEIDAREIPKGWKTGYVPLRKTTPYEEPRVSGDTSEAYHLNARLVDWAFQLTKDVKLMDSRKMQAARMAYKEPNARRPPFVLKGDDLSGSTFWTGKLLDEWANDWVKYQTGGKANYVMTAMEDTGVMQALTFVTRAGKVDVQRVMVLRTASDFDQPRPGQTPAEDLKELNTKGYPGYLPALEAAWRVGNTVVTEITANWPRYRDQMPGTH
jgi:purine nucleoside permease